MTNYRLRPAATEIEARQWAPGTDPEELAAWCDGWTYTGNQHGHTDPPWQDHTCLDLQVTETSPRGHADPGDWIVRLGQDEYEVLPPPQFEAKYEPAPVGEVPDGMVVYEVPRTGGGVAFRVGVTGETGSVVLITSLPYTLLADPAEVDAASLVFEQARTEQARIHRALYPPPEPSEAMLADALAAYAGVMTDERYLRGSSVAIHQSNAMIAALTAAGIYEPELLRIALRAYRQHVLLDGLATGTEDRKTAMRRALSAVLRARA